MDKEADSSSILGYHLDEEADSKVIIWIRKYKFERQPKVGVSADFVGKGVDSKYPADTY